MGKTLVFKASGKEEGNENKEEKFKQNCHEAMEVILSAKGEPGTTRHEPALVGSYDEKTDENSGLSQEAETKTEEEKYEDERKEGKAVKEENECKYPDYSDKDLHPTCDVSEFDSIG